MQTHSFRRLASPRGSTHCGSLVCSLALRKARRPHQKSLSTMCSNPQLSAAVNSAKCASVGALLAGILACLGFLVGGWLAGIGGILGIIASSMLLCCGPSNKGEGKGMVRAAAGSTTRDAGRRFFAPLSALSRKPASSRLTPALKLTGSDLSLASTRPRSSSISSRPFSPWPAWRWPSPPTSTFSPQRKCLAPPPNCFRPTPRGYSY